MHIFFTIIAEFFYKSSKDYPEKPMLENSDVVFYQKKEQ